MRRLVVTGGCGFIGRNLLEVARAHGAAVRVVDDLSAGTRDDLEAFGPVERLAAPGPWPWTDAIQVLRADVRDAAVVRRACRDADAVVHLAAATGIVESLADPLGHATANVLGTVAVLEACRQEGVARCVVASSGAAVGAALPPVHEATLPAPISPYGASKLAAEAYVHAYRASFGLAAVALRFSNVYGPHSAHKSSVVAGFIGRVLAGRPLVVYGDGRQTRDFVFVRDLVAAIWAALGTPALPGAVYQVASGVETPIGELVRLLGDLAEARLGRRPVVEHRPRRPGEVERNSADVSRARRELGLAEPTPLPQGLAITFDWFLARRGG